MHLRRLIATFALAGTAAAAQAGAVLTQGNLLVNSDFESSNVDTDSYKYVNYAVTPVVSASGWTFSGGSGIANRSNAWGGAATSSAVVFLQSYPGFDVPMLSQSFNGPFPVLTIAFSAAQRPGNSESLRVVLDGIDLTPTLLTPLDAGWSSYTLTATNLSARSHTLSFIGVNTGGAGDSSLFLDNIGVFGSTQADIAVPEPGSLALVGAALAGLGLARRRRPGQPGSRDEKVTQ